MAKLDFRQGIARRQEDGSGNPNNLQPSSGGSWVDVLVSPDPTVFTFAHYDTDYMQTENATVPQAWGPFTAGTDYWLYWDVDFLTGELTRDFSLLEPTYGPNPPPTLIDQHWFDTNETVMKVWSGSSWVEKLRVFAAKYASGATLIHYPLGSQVGLNGVSVNVGKILYDPDGNPLQKFQRNRRGQFITTETPLNSQFNRIANFRVEAAIVQGEAQETIPINHAVALSGFDELVLARSSNPSLPAIGIATEDMNPGEVRSYITKGFITDEANWNWSAYPARTSLFVGANGELIPAPEASATTQQQIGYIVNKTTVFVEVGEQVSLEPPNANEVGLLVDRDNGRRIGRKIPFTLEDLRDTDISNPQDGDVIMWDSLLGKWVLESNCCGGGGGSTIITSSSSGLFVTGVSSPGGGIIADFVYAANTVPADTVVLEATSDQEIVRIEFLVEGSAMKYSPSVVVDTGTGSPPSGGSNVVGILTQDPQDLRTFHGYADISVADGLLLGREINLQASHGATASVLIKRAPDAPEIQTLLFDSIYPTVSPDPTSGYPGGTQTSIKAGDDFYVFGTVENSATLVSLQPGGAVEVGTFTTDTAGGWLGPADSGGAGYKLFNIQFTASIVQGTQTAVAEAQNSFGSTGSPFITSNTVDMDQVTPSVNIGAIAYPPGQLALKNSDNGVVANTVTGHDHIYYYENGGAGFISIASPNVYEPSKSVTRTGGDYLYDGDNFAIKAYKTSNGTITDVNSDVNISNVAPTVDIAGATSRLISSPSGENYIITLTFSQQLLQAPTILSSGDPTAGNRGAWSGGGDIWSFTMTVDDADDKGIHTWTVNNVNTLSNNLYNGIVISSGGTYELGGFTTRLVTIGALEQVEDLGVAISDPSKVVVKYAGTADNLTYRASDLTQFAKGWSTVDGSQLVFTAGAEPFPNYSNFVFQDPLASPSSWFYLTDAFFAGANTTGTLTIEIGEVA